MQARGCRGCEGFRRFERGGAMEGKRMRPLCSESQRDKAWKSLGELDRSRFSDRKQTRQTAALCYAGGGPGEDPFLESASRHGSVEQTAHGGFSQHRRCSMCRCTTIFAWVRAWALSQTPCILPTLSFFGFPAVPGRSFMFAVHLCERIVRFCRGDPYPLRCNLKGRRDHRK